MTYAVSADLQTRFGATEVAALGDETRLNSALADAASEINSHLARAYALPLTGTIPVLTAIACDLARVRLYDDTTPETVLRRAQSARKRLKEIADGTTDLVTDAGDVVKRLASRGADATAQTRALDPEAMQAF